MKTKGIEITMGVIACILLLIYTLTLGDIIISVYSWNSGSGKFTANENAVWIVYLIGGLVSGVVIGNFALTDPGNPPVSQVKALSEAYGKRLMEVLVYIYVAVWLIVGMASLWVGVIKCPDVYETLTEIGKSWLGILVGAGYAWFGIKKT